MFTPLALTAEAPSASRLASPEGSGREAKIEIVLGNGRRVIELMRWMPPPSGISYAMRVLDGICVARKRVCD